MTAPLSDQEIEALILSCEPLDRGGRGSISFALRQLRRQRDEARNALETCEAAARSARKIQGVSEIPDNERSASYGYGLIVVTVRAALAKAPSDAR